ncbi:hypothetical protein J1605_011470 [Eschrichtius robustus]|uniref:FH2 domain-containing protein n=1 Tax=Eschrichtius robustus TaxID=9764 RepID=A0AB34GQ31_ESCRO|nr:hypothetical protein J1605_011470 [Eschrichtius robustus]
MNHFELLCHAELLNLRLEWSKGVVEQERTKAQFELQAFHIRGEHAVITARLEETIENLKYEIEHRWRGECEEMRDVCVSTDDDCPPKTFRNVCIQTDRETFLKPCEGPAPPPPPGLFFGVNASASQCPRKPAVEPSCPMKPLYWTRIQISDKSQNSTPTLWDSLEEPDIRDTSEFEYLFSKDTPQQKKKPLSESYEKKNKIKKLRKPETVGNSKIRLQYLRLTQSHASAQEAASVQQLKKCYSD